MNHKLGRVQGLLHRLSELAKRWQTGWRRTAITLFFLALSVFVIATLVVSNWSTFREFEWRVTPLWLVVATGLLVVVLAFSAFVWHLIVSRHTEHRTMRGNMKYWAYANLAKRLPGAVWYVGSRALMYEQAGVSKRTTAYLSSLELLFIMLSGITMFLLILPLWVLPEDLSQQIDRFRIVLIFLPLGFLLVHPKLLNFISAKFIRNFQLQKVRWRDSISWFLIYIIIWLVGAAVLFSVINFVHPLSYMQAVPVVGMWIIANLVSLAGALTFVSFGLREFSLLLLLTQLTPTPVALVITILLRLLWMIGELLGAAISLIL